MARGIGYMTTNRPVLPYGRNIDEETARRLKAGGATGDFTIRSAPAASGGGLRSGPMGGIYVDQAMDPHELAMVRGLGLRGRYNAAEPRSAGRADVLEQIWDRGGVPGIGRGGVGAPVQDFGGVSRGVRGVDTGMAVGSPEAEAHAEALEAAGGAGGIYGSPTGAYRRLAPTRTRGSGGGGLGMFTADRVTRQPTKAERALQGAMALESAKNAGQVEAARIGAEAEQYKADKGFDAERYKADKQAETEKIKAEAAKQMQGVRRDRNGIYYGADGNPLPEEQQKAWTRRNLYVRGFRQSFGKQAGQFLNNGNQPDAAKRLVPVYDQKTDALKYISEQQYNGGSDKKQEMIGPKGKEIPRYLTLAQFDPILAYQYEMWISQAAGA